MKYLKQLYWFWTGRCLNCGTKLDDYSGYSSQKCQKCGYRNYNT